MGLLDDIDTKNYRYETRIVAFLDILNFKELVNESKNNCLFASYSVRYQI